MADALTLERNLGGAPFRSLVQDQLSNRLVTDSAGNTVEQMGHYPFGDPWYNATNDKLVFTTYERDSESGNDYAQARFYRWLLGRFLSLDPLSGSTSDPQSLDRYTYVENNPTNLVDPSGMDECLTGDYGACSGGDGGFGGSFSFMGGDSFGGQGDANGLGGNGDQSSGLGDLFGNSPPGDPSEAFQVSIPGPPVIFQDVVHSI